MTGFLYRDSAQRRQIASIGRMRVPFLHTIRPLAPSLWAPGFASDVAHPEHDRAAKIGLVVAGQFVIRHLRFESPQRSRNDPVPVERDTAMPVSQPFHSASAPTTKGAHRAVRQRHAVGVIVELRHRAPATGHHPVAAVWSDPNEAPKVLPSSISAIGG